MTNKYWLMAGLPLAAMAILNGCSGGVSGEGDVTVHGKAIDPYLAQATVCVDSNKNQVCDNTEVSVKSDDNGSYTLTVSHEDLVSGPAVILVTGGTDTATEVHFNGTLTALADANHTEVHVTPLSSVVTARYQYCQNNTSCEYTTQEDITGQVAGYFDLNTTDVEGDIVYQANHHHIQALKVALSLETVAEANASDFYKRVAEKIDKTSSDWGVDINAIFNGASDVITGIMAITEADVAGEGNCTADGIALYVHAHAQQNNGGGFPLHWQ